MIRRWTCALWMRLPCVVTTRRRSNNANWNNESIVLRRRCSFFTSFPFIPKWFLPNLFYAFETETSWWSKQSKWSQTHAPGAAIHFAALTLSEIIKREEFQLCVINSGHLSGFFCTWSQLSTMQSHFRNGKIMLFRFVAAKRKFQSIARRLTVVGQWIV